MGVVWGQNELKIWKSPAVLQSVQCKPLGPVDIHNVNQKVYVTQMPLEKKNNAKKSKHLLGRIFIGRARISDASLKMWPSKSVRSREKPNRSQYFAHFHLILVFFYWKLYFCCGYSFKIQRQQKRSLSDLAGQNHRSNSGFSTTWNGTSRALQIGGKYMSRLRVAILISKMSRIMLIFPSKISVEVL